MFQKFWGVIFFLAFSPAAWAYDYDFYTGGIYYNITSSSDKTVEVTNKYLSGGNYYSGDVTIPETITHNETEYRVTAIGKTAFLLCDRLKTVTIPESVTSIGNGAFRGCTGLTEVTIPESVTSIGSQAFLDCKGLTEITIPESVTSIGNEVFRDCTGLTSVTILNTSIGDMAFSGCTGLTSVTIPESVTAIGDGTFSGCTGLTEFKGKFASDNGHCLIVNDTLKAFAPSGLNRYAIPDGVTAIGKWAFVDYTGLTSVTIGDGVTSIGKFAFSGCSGLKEVTIGNSVTTIGDYAFYITGLTSVTIPESVIAIGDYAFYFCSQLNTVTSLNPIPSTIAIKVFDDRTYKNAVFHYPKGAMVAYLNSPWGSFIHGLLHLELVENRVGETTYSCTLRDKFGMEFPVSSVRCDAENTNYTITPLSASVTVTDLEPQTEYEAKFFVETKYGDLLTCETSFTTDTVKLTTLPAINISNTSATLTADIACDAVIGAGFEWRRYDDPELVPSTFSETPIVDGKISGTLRNLTPEKYYKYRPFYRTVSGKYYYGAWSAFGTRDVYAYFEPTVSTRSGEVHGNNSTISGYIVEGSDELLSQGFEYWAETPVSRSTASNPERIEGSGSLMSVTLTGLDYNTTYYYRAYATTAKKTTYGNTESFTTGEDPNLSGIEETAAEEGFAVRLSGNPVRNGEIGVQVVGADGATWYRVISLHGAQIAQGVLSGTDEWQPVKIPAASTGYYLLQIIGSKGTKTLRIVVE